MAEEFSRTPSASKFIPWNKGKLRCSTWRSAASLTVRQRKTGRPVKFELTDQTRQAIDDYLKAASKKPGEFLFSGRPDVSRSMTTRQYARLSGLPPKAELQPERLMSTRPSRRIELRSRGAGLRLLRHGVLHFRDQLLERERLGQELELAAVRQALGEGLLGIA